MSDLKPDLTALLGSRICHDLISPLGAIGNGIELLALGGGPMAPELALISESVLSANARIRFFRIAYGASQGDQRISRAEASAILGDLWRGGRLTVDWLTDADLSRREAKILFLLLQCLESAMPFGGRIRVDRSGSRWILTGLAQKMRIEQALWEILVNREPDSGIEAGQVHFALAAEEFHRQHRRLTAEIRATEIRLEF